MQNIENFFKKLSASNIYKQLDPESLENQIELLDDITEMVNKTIVKNFKKLFPYLDKETFYLAQDFPFDKMYRTFIERKDTPEKKEDISNLIKTVIHLSQQYIPFWYNETGKLYFENSGAKKSLEL